MKLGMVGLIAGRECRDLARDRRSVFLLVILPIVLYPGFGVVGFLFALTQLERTSVVGVAGIELLSGVKRNGHTPLIEKDRFSREYFEHAPHSELMRVVPVDGNGARQLEAKEVDVVVVFPLDLDQRITAGQSATVEVKNRDGDEISKLATYRVTQVLKKYGEALKQSRFSAHHLTSDFDQPLVVREPKADEPLIERTSAELRDQLAKFFPFLLVMWALAGALHPAIDLCAGEKERGTMETLLISPATRMEIVAGKFLAVWGYATITAWWNLVWMGGLCISGSWFLEVSLIRPASLIACFVMTLPLTALFASLSIALGAYARSTKEGQYYLLPLFLGVMPLVLLSLSPTAELSIGMCSIPITGFCLVLQKMIGPTPWAEVLPYSIPAFLSLLFCALAATWWAVRQFHREDVLFRDTESSVSSSWLAGLTGR